MSDGPKLLNQKDTARRLGVSVNTFVRYYRRHIPTKGGKRPMYPVELIDTYASSVDGCATGGDVATDDAEFWLRKMRERDK